jgi:hypothetical protein
MDSNNTTTFHFDDTKFTRRRGHRYRHSFDSDSDNSLREDDENPDHRTSPLHDDLVSNPFGSAAEKKIMH